MKSYVVALLIALVSSSYAHAKDDVEGNATTRVKWRGDLTWLSLSGTCSSWNPTLEHMIARFRPSGLGTNGSYSNLTLFYQTYALGFRVSGRFGTAFRTVDAQDIGSGMGYWNPAVRFTSQVPAVLTTATDQLVINGQIRGFDYTPTCTATFRATLQRDYQD